ncbi:replication associated protein [Lepus americanus faeces associated genomovirus SHP11]|nr:replication associated protein [Lepus americanus faeces associated genomovirus SHP11]
MVRRFKLEEVSYVLLTYPTTPDGFDPQGIIDAVVAAGAVYRLGRELHADGKPHYHCFVQWADPYSDPDAGGTFTVGGRRPNIKKFSANPGRRWDYVGKHAGKKEGHFIIGDQCERPSEGDVDTRSQSDIWSEIIGCTTQEEFWSKLAALAPKQLGCNFGSLKLYVDWKYKPAQEIYETPQGTFDVPGVLQEPKGLVLFGPTRIGKTVWARSLADHAYFGGLFNLDDFSADGAQYAIFDDISGGFSFFPSYKQWMGGQYQFTVTDKYKHKVTLRWGRPTIWLCNTDPREDHYKPGAMPDFAWMEENCVFYECRDTIFHAST